MRYSLSILLLGLLGLPTFSSAQCTAVCQNVATGLTNCKNLYNAGVVGGAPLNEKGISCACGPLILDDLQACSDCGQAATLVSIWVIACTTYRQSGVQAGIACFEALDKNPTDISMCAPPNRAQSLSSIRSLTTSTPINALISASTTRNIATTPTSANTLVPISNAKIFGTTSIGILIASSISGNSVTTSFTGAPRATPSSTTTNPATPQQVNGGTISPRMERPASAIALGIAVMMLITPIF